MWPFMRTGPKIIVEGFTILHLKSNIKININFEVKHTLLIVDLLILKNLITPACSVTCHHSNILDVKRLWSQSFLPNSINLPFGLKNKASLFFLFF